MGARMQACVLVSYKPLARTQKNAKTLVVMRH